MLGQVGLDGGQGQRLGPLQHRLLGALLHSRCRSTSQNFLFHLLDNRDWVKAVVADVFLCLFAQAVAQKQKMSAKVQKKFAKRIGGSGGATNGLSSTVAFTPLQVCPLYGRGRNPHHQELFL